MALQSVKTITPEFPVWLQPLINLSFAFEPFNVPNVAFWAVSLNLPVILFDALHFEDDAGRFAHGPNMAPLAPIAIDPQWTADQRTGTVQLRLPRGLVRLVTPLAATAPCPSLVTFARLPLAGQGEMDMT